MDTLCTNDYLGIDGAGLMCTTGTNGVIHSRLCGGFFNLEEGQTNDVTAICGMISVLFVGL